MDTPSSTPQDHNPNENAGIQPTIDSDGAKGKPPISAVPAQQSDDGIANPGVPPGATSMPSPATTPALEDIVANSQGEKVISSNNEKSGAEKSESLSESLKSLVERLKSVPGAINSTQLEHICDTLKNALKTDLTFTQGNKVDGTFHLGDINVYFGKERGEEVPAVGENVKAPTQIPPRRDADTQPAELPLDDKDARMVLFVCTYFAEVSPNEFVTLARALYSSPDTDPESSAETQKKRHPTALNHDEESFHKVLETTRKKCRAKFDSIPGGHLGLKLHDADHEAARAYFEEEGYLVCLMYFQRLERASFVVSSSPLIRKGMVVLAQRFIANESTASAAAILEKFRVSLLEDSEFDDRYALFGGLLDALQRCRDEGKKRMVVEILEKLLHRRLTGSPVLAVLACPFLTVTEQIRWLGRIIEEGDFESRKLAKRSLLKSLQPGSKSMKETWASLATWFPKAERNPQQYSNTNRAAIELAMVFFVRLFVPPDKPCFEKVEIDTVAEISSRRPKLQLAVGANDSALRTKILALCHLFDASFHATAPVPQADTTDQLKIFDTTLGAAIAGAQSTTARDGSHFRSDLVDLVFVEVFAEWDYQLSTNPDEGARSLQHSEIAERLAGALAKPARAKAIEHLLTAEVAIGWARVVLSWQQTDTRLEHERIKRMDQRLGQRARAYKGLAKSLGKYKSQRLPRP